MWTGHKLKASALHKSQQSQLAAGASCMQLISASILAQANRLPLCLHKSWMRSAVQPTAAASSRNDCARSQQIDEAPQGSFSCQLLSGKLMQGPCVSNADGSCVGSPSVLSTRSLRQAWRSVLLYLMHQGGALCSFGCSEQPMPTESFQNASGNACISEDYPAILRLLRQPVHQRRLSIAHHNCRVLSCKTPPNSSPVHIDVISTAGMMRHVADVNPCL